MASNDDRRQNPQTGRPRPCSCTAASLRSQFGETSEALFLTQGFVYDCAEQAEARFKNEDPGYQYSRFGNPTVAMFEERIRLLEGADEARATATGMAAVNAALLSYLKAGDHLVSARALFGACRYIVETLCPRFGIASTLVDGRDLEAWRKAIRPNTKMFFFETPSNPTLELDRHRRRLQAGEGDRRARRRRQRVRDAHVAAPARSTAPTSSSTRRPSTSTARAAVSAAPCWARTDYVTNHLQEYLRQTGPDDEPVQRLGHAQGPGDDAGARARADGDRGQDRRSSRRAGQASAACSIAGAPTIRRPRSRAGR